VRHDSHDVRQRAALEVIREDIATIASTLESVQERLAQFKLDEERLVSELAELRRQEGYWSQKLGEPVAPVAIASQASGRNDAPVIEGIQVSRSGRISHADAAMKILEEHGRPLSTRDIIVKLAEIRHPMPDSHTARLNAIYSGMWRREKDFIRMGNGIWGLVGRDEKIAEEEKKGALFNTPDFKNN
jgi:hypothetical protein